MSCKLMERALALAAPISHAAFRVLMVLAKHANDDGSHCYPSMQTIEDMGQMTRDSVVRCLEQLTEAGLIVCERRKGRKGNTYQVTLGGKPPEKVAPGHPLPALNGHTTPPFRASEPVDNSANDPTIGPLKSPITGPLTFGNSPIVGGNSPIIGPDSLNDSKKEREGNKPFGRKEGSKPDPEPAPEPLADPAAVKAAVGSYLGNMHRRIAGPPGCWPKRTPAEQIEAMEGLPNLPKPVDPVRTVAEQLAILLGTAQPAALEVAA